MTEEGKQQMLVLGFWQRWLPTAKNLNLLPEPVRCYIRDLETRCDPAGDLRELILTRDRVRQLEAVVAELKRTIQEWRP